MTLQQLICLGVETQLLETGFVFVLGNKDKHELATQSLYFRQLALLQAYTVSTVWRVKPIKIISLNAGGQLKTVSWLRSKYLSVKVREVSAAFSQKNLSHRVTGSLRREPKWKKLRLPGDNALLRWGSPYSEVINWDPEPRKEQTLEQWQSHKTPSHGMFVKKVKNLSHRESFCKSYNFLKSLDNGIRGTIFMGRELLSVQASSPDFVARVGSPSWSGPRFLSSFISSIHPTLVVELQVSKLLELLSKCPFPDAWNPLLALTQPDVSWQVPQLLPQEST